MRRLRGRPAEGCALSEDWPAAGFEAALRERERLVVLYYADWCPFSRMLLPLFEAAEPEASAPFARANLRHPQDARWDDARVHTVPTLVYYESGEELERVEAVRRKGLARADLEDFLETVDAIQPEPVLPRRMHGPKRFS